MTDFTRRRILTGLATITIASVLPNLASANDSKINWNAWRTDAKDFYRAPVLLTGENEAILLDTSFNYPAGHSLVKEITATGKRLSTVYISCSDPDYYFNLKLVKDTFPDVKIIAASETLQAIKNSVQKKIDVWGPRLGEHGPQSLEEIVYPEAYDEPTIDMEGTRIDIVTSQLMQNRRYLWVPSIEAVFGGVYSFEGLHVWTADTPSPEDRSAWITELGSLIAHKPKIVVAGHATDRINNGPESLNFTRDYLISYEKEVSGAKNSSDLIAAMKRLYPGLGLLPGLEIGAKVAKGEMSWG